MRIGCIRTRHRVVLRQVLEHARVQGGKQLSQQRVGVGAEELLVVRRALRVPVILLADADQQLVDQRVAEPRHLRERPRPHIATGPLAQDPYSLPRRGGPDADHGGRIVNAGRRRPVTGQLVDGDLQRQRVDVGRPEGIHSWHARHEPSRRQAEHVVVGGERPQVSQVEDGAQVDVEAIGPLAGERYCRVVLGTHVYDRLGSQRGVARGGKWADVAGWNREVLTENDARHWPRPAVAIVDPGEGIGLLPVPVCGSGTGQRCDRTVVVEEGGGNLVRGGEGELERDVRIPISRVVDVDRIDHVVGELIEVRSPVGRLQRDVVGDQGHRAFDIGTHEGVQVG